MKNTMVLQKNSWANKAVALFTSVALVMAVTVPAPAYAAETDDAEIKNEAPALALTERAAVEDAEITITKAVEDVTTAEEAPVVEATPASEEAQATDETQAIEAIPVAESTAKAKAATPKATATLGQFQVQGDEGSYAYENNVLTVMGDVVVSTVAKTAERIVIVSDATVTLGGVDIETSSAAAAITVESSANAIINLLANTVNNVTGGKNHAGIEVAWHSESDFASLAIEGEGELNAKGGSVNGGAGVGGSYDENAGLYGDITVNGGTVHAEGTNRAAGIGSSNNPTNYGNVDTVRGAIVINGGDVTAKGVGNGAGIGGGNHMSSGAIVINGGTVYAEGDSGIGSGLGSSSGADKGPGHFWADVTVNGGDVTAYATNNMGAGIGGGMYGDAYVTINGGTVDASVNLDGKEYQGGAGIGGGYQGAAIVTITGGDITAYGGNGSAGIGNGALVANTTSNKYSDAKGWYDTKNVRTGAPKIAIEDSKVEIMGGTVLAYGGYAAAGIGSGNSSEWVNVIISGGDVTAIGYASTEDEMEGAAGIGSGAAWVTDKIAYMKETTENIAINGGNIIAIGGWGAAGIGSGAKNATADSIVIDAENANVQAYADGTKFAIDTPVDNVGSNASVAGNILQGTFVHAYTDNEGNNQGTEGLKSIILKNEATGEVKQLTLMPEGYRSYAADVNGAGVYSVYTDSSAIGASGQDEDGNGAHFSVNASDQWSGDEEGNKPVTYGVATDELSNYLYLYPVKTIMVETVVEIIGATDGVAAELASSINQAFNFAIHSHKGAVLESADGTPWIQTIEVIGGIAQGNAYFANVNDGSFEIWEVDENGESLAVGTQYGDLILTGIRTEHGGGSDNNAEISQGVWKDIVRVVNVFTAVSVEPAATATPAAPAAPTTPTTPTATPISATAEAAAPATTTPVAQETIAEDAVPLAGPVESVVIDDDATPLAGHEHGAECWVHWWMILGMLVTAVYSIVVIVRRTRDDEQDDADQDNAGNVQDNDNFPFGYGTKLQTATFMTQEA